MEEDVTYFEKMTADKKAKVKTVLEAMKAQKLTNKYIQAAVLAVASKESDFALREEASYKNTSIARIRQVFPSSFRNKSDAEIEALKKDDKAFFDFLYGGKYGNAKDEGYKYRGRGLNQLTFKANYRLYGSMIHQPLVEQPDLMAQMPIAAACMVAYFVDHLLHAPTLQQNAYHFTGMNDFKNTTDAADAAYNANAGWGKSPEACRKDQTGGYKRTHARVKGFLKIIEGGL
jgi:predicted chitinase